MHPILVMALIIFAVTSVAIIMEINRINAAAQPSRKSTVRRAGPARRKRAADIPAEPGLKHAERPISALHRTAH